MKRQKVFSSVKTESLSEMVVGQVLEALFAGELAPGQFFGTEAQLAEVFQTSRVPIREALSRLAAMGVVNIKTGSGGGATIGSGDPDQFATALAVQFMLIRVSTKEIFEARIAIESMAAELVAREASDEAIAHLRHLLGAVQAGEKAEPADLSRAILAFRMALVEASGNRTLIALMSALLHVLHNTYLRLVLPRQDGTIAGSMAAMLEAIEARDPDLAAAEARAMLIRARDSILRRIEEGEIILSGGPAPARSEPRALPGARAKSRRREVTV
jgi:GntR family transcriptional repressor for pyruvate dehydrogenase complex